MHEFPSWFPDSIVIIQGKFVEDTKNCMSYFIKVGVKWRSNFRPLLPTYFVKGSTLDVKELDPNLDRCRDFEISARNWPVSTNAHNFL